MSTAVNRSHPDRQAAGGPEVLYRERHEQRREEVRRLDRNHRLLANARLAIFSAGAVLACWHGSVTGSRAGGSWYRWWCSPS
jgi:hypothetical protein